MYAYQLAKTNVLLQLLHSSKFLAKDDLFLQAADSPSWQKLLRAITVIVS